MNKSVTSRAQLLAAAKDLSYSQGLDRVNIRAVAAKCGVAVGSIYNYFPTKANLIAAVIEDFWREAAHREACAVEARESFSHYVGRLYIQFSRDLSAFPSGWLSQMTSISQDERRQGRELETKCFVHIRAALVLALGQDSRAPASADERDALAAFTFCHCILLLREGQSDCAFLQRVLDGFLSHQCPAGRG